jgi:protein gp37
MAETTNIEWTSATWNVITGCSIKSLGCNNCYAMKLAGTRLQHHPSRAGLTKETKNGPAWTGEVRFNDQWLNQPLIWKSPKDIFVVAHGDLFHENVPDRWIDIIFDVMRRTPWHRYQVLTKRSDGMRRIMQDRAPMPHVWLGVSAERQQEADIRRDDLAALAASGWNTWVSYEPALGLVDWTGWHFLRWFVSGGESGTGARPSHPDWHRDARDFCIEHHIPYFFKQWGNWQTTYDRDVDDPDWSNCPSDDQHPNGRYLNLAGGFGFHGDRVVFVKRVPKKLAGHMLDGEEWHEMPEVAHALV